MDPLFFHGDRTYSFLFWSVFAFWMLFELIASGFKRPRASSNARDRGSLFLILILFWVGVFLAFSASFLLPQASLHWNQGMIFFLGISCMLLGIAFRWYAIRVLGRFFTVNVAIHPEHTLVQTGPYRYIRHPSYTGALITQFGFGLALGNWASISAILLCMAIAYTYRISIEESALMAALGAPYREYMRRTSRLIPFLF